MTGGNVWCDRMPMAPQRAPAAQQEQQVVASTMGGGVVSVR
jgi:hypothetical protein